MFSVAKISPWDTKMYTLRPDIFTLNVMFLFQVHGALGGLGEVDGCGCELLQRPVWDAREE
jgi:hypothetical protein